MNSIGNDKNNNRSVLIITEDRKLSLIIQKKIQTAPISVRSVFSAGQALAEMKKQEKDLLLIDAHLSDMTVERFIHILKKNNMRIPFIILAESKDPAIAVAMMKLGAHDYIIKKAGYIDELPTYLTRVFDELLVENRLLRAEATIIRREIQLHTIINSNVDGMIIADKKGFVHFVNPAAEKLFNRKRETLLGEQFGFPMVVGDRIEIQIPLKSKPPITVEMRVTGIEWEGQECYLASLRDITIHKLDKEKLRQERDKAQTYLQIADVMILALDVEGKVVLINDKGCEILEDNSKKIIGKNWFDHFVTPTERAVVKNVFTAIISDKKKRYCFHENRIISKHGKSKIISWHNELIKDDKGRIIGTISSGEDVTAKRQFEKRQSLSADILKLLNESRIKDSIIRLLLQHIKEFTLVDAIGIRLKQGEDYPYYEVNGFTDAFVKQGGSLYNYNGNGALINTSNGKPLLACMCGRIIKGNTESNKSYFTDFGSFWLNDLEKHLKAQDSKGHEYFTNKHCFEFGYKSISFIPLRSGDEILGLLQLNSLRKNHFTLDQIHFLESIAASIGIALKRIQTQDELTQSREQFMQFFENEPHYCYMISPAGTIMDANKAALQTLGYKRQELIDKPVHIIYAPENHNKVNSVLSQWLQKGIVTNQELNIISKNGETRTILLNAAVVKDKQGKILHSISVQTDITEKKQLEEQLLHSQKMEAIGTLAGGVAHDFNNILSIIINYAQFLLEKMDAKSQEYLDCNEIIKAGQKAANLTRQLLAFSRKQVLQSRPVDINGMIKDLGKMLYRLIGEDITLILTLDPANPFILVDPGQMEQVIMNLVVNARDAIAKGGKLNIKTEHLGLEAKRHTYTPSITTGGYMRISIIDTGAGISQDIIDKIFDPFFSTKQLGKGTGLGLSVVYGIIKQHDGDITVSSEPGKGTRFDIYLPECKRQPEKGKRERIPIKNLYGKGEKILVVEDNKTILGYLKRALTSYGYNVVSASSARQALELFTRQKDDIELLLSDVVLPDISGLELAKNLTAQKPELKVILSSGYLDEKSRGEDIIKCGLSFIQKPFKGEDLLQTIKSLL